MLDKILKSIKLASLLNNSANDVYAFYKSECKRHSVLPVDQKTEDEVFCYFTEKFDIEVIYNENQEAFFIEKIKESELKMEPINKVEVLEDDVFKNFNKKEDEDLNVTKDRDKYIGGSDVPVILGISPFQTRQELLNFKAGKTPAKEVFENQYIRFGNLAEPKIRDYINQHFRKGNYNFAPDTLLIENEGLDFRANVDGFDKDLNVLLEIKTCGEFDKSYDMYYAQIQFYLQAYNLDICILAQYLRPQKLWNEFTFEPESLKVSIIKKDIDYIDNTLMPAIDKFNEDIKTLKNGGKEEDTLQPDLKKAFDELIKLTTREKRAAEGKKKANAKVAKLMQKYDLPKFKDEEGYSFSFQAPKEETTEEVEDFDLDSLKLIFPEVYEQFKITKTKVKKGKAESVIMRSPKNE